MEIPKATTAFRSDIRRYIVFFGKLSVFMSVMLFAAVVIGQIRADRFPVYYDLLVVPLYSIPVFFFLAFATYGAASYFKVAIGPDSMRCYNSLGRYATANWSEISEVQPVVLCGVPYLLVHGNTLSRPMTLPVWLESLDEFAACVETWAGADHPLSEMLRDVVQGN